MGRTYWSSAPSVLGAFDLESSSPIRRYLVDIRINLPLEDERLTFRDQETFQSPCLQRLWIPMSRLGAG
jgi:hypothetical protein